MVVLKFRLLFYIKKNLQKRNPKRPVGEELTAEVEICLGQEAIKLSVNVDKQKCSDVWPRVVKEIRQNSAHKGCMIRAVATLTANVLRSSFEVSPSKMAAVWGISFPSTSSAVEKYLHRPRRGRWIAGSGSQWMGEVRLYPAQKK